MNKIITLMVMVLTITFLSVSPSQASAKDKIENFFKHVPVPIIIPIPVPSRDYDRSPRHRRDRHDRYDRRDRRRHIQSGHWESRRVWTAPVYERRWVGGYYSDRKDRWIRGGYKRVILREGYYTENRVYVRHY